MKVIKEITIVLLMLLMFVLDHTIAYQIEETQVDNDQIVFK